MFGNSRVALAYVPGLCKNRPDGLHLFVRQTVNTLNLCKQSFILFLQGRAPRGGVANPNDE
jgi:hypothetical protein